MPIPSLVLNLCYEAFLTYENTTLSDRLAFAEVMGVELEEDWESLIPELLDEQVQTMVEDIILFNEHYWENAIPRPGFYHMEQRVKADLSLLMKIKKQNLRYSRLMKFLLNKVPTELKENFIIKHGIHRFMTAVGIHDRLHKRPEIPQKEEASGPDKKDRGQCFRHLYMLFDYYVDVRKDPNTHPIRKWEKRLHENPVYYDIDRQKEDLGEDWKEPIYDLIGIKPAPEEEEEEEKEEEGERGNEEEKGEEEDDEDEEEDEKEEEVLPRFPRLYAIDGDISPETGAKYLKFLTYKDVGKMRPKHTARYFADEVMEPWHHVQPPAPVKRHFMERWIKNFHQIKFKETQHKEECYGPHRDYGQKKMEFHLDTMKKRFVEAAGYDVSKNARKKTRFEELASWMDCDHNVHGMPIESTSIWEEKEERHEFCFHRNPHVCPKCCALDPVQELFAARTTDHPFLVCYHPIHELS